MSDFVIENGVLKNYTGSGEDVVIPEGVSSIGERAFRGCKTLTNVAIPNGVTSIGDAAFAFCDSLKSVTIPEGVTSIGKEVFCGCSNLRCVSIPEGVTSIGYEAFYKCSRCFCRTSSDCSLRTQIILTQGKRYGAVDRITRSAAPYLFLQAQIK